jgi:hypothetical protein
MSWIIPFKDIRGEPWKTLPWPIEPTPIPLVVPRDFYEDDDEYPVSKDEIISIRIKKDKEAMKKARKTINDGLRTGIQSFDITKLDNQQVHILITEYTAAGWKVQLINNDKRLEFK